MHHGSILRASREGLMRDKGTGIQPYPAFWIGVHRTWASHFQERLLRRPKAHVLSRNKPPGSSAGATIRLLSDGKPRNRRIFNRRSGLIVSQRRRRSRRKSRREQRGPEAGRSADVFLALGYAESGIPRCICCPEFHNLHHIVLASASNNQ